MIKKPGVPPTVTRLVTAALVVVATGVSGMVVPAGAQPATPQPLSGPTTLCNNQTGMVYDSHHRAYILRTPHWRGKAGSLCVHSSGHAQFSVIKVPVTDNHVNSFPDMITGCRQWVCTPRSKMPIKVRRLHTLRSTWWIRGRGTRGIWNAAYDIWLGKRPFNPDGTSTRSGAELMIWPNYSESYAGNQIVRIDGRRWYFMHWRTCDHVRDGHHHGGVPAADATCFNYISFRAVHRVWRVNHIDLRAFMRWAIRHGHRIRPTWWVEDIATGFELWRGGVGLGTTKFSVTVRKTLATARPTVRDVRTVLDRAGFRGFVITRPKDSARLTVTPQPVRLLPRYAKVLRRHGYTVNADPTHPRSRLVVS
jgi:hypothetical protein